MKRITRSVVVLSLSLVSLGLLGLIVRGSMLPAPSSGTWAPTPGVLAEARSGSAAAMLSDGRVLVTGGDGAASAPLASAELFSLDGSFTPVAPMTVARSKHVAVALKDGRVLVAGGLGLDGKALSSAEIYDPASNVWQAALPMVEARSGSTATLLADGRVLVAGGATDSAASASLEVFDPVSDGFVSGGMMSTPRQDHAAARLADDRILLIAGSDGNVVLGSSELWDPTTGQIVAGPAISVPRQGLSATTLIDGTVLLAGGNDGTNDLAVTEILDPAAGTVVAGASMLSSARRDHLAVLLPHNASVLIVGGTAAGVPVAGAELYVPWSGGSNPTGSPSAARALAVSSPTGTDGLLLLAGGKDASGTLLNSGEVYGFATVKTDAADYPPGTQVLMSGSGWEPGDTVNLTLHETGIPDPDPDIILTVTADAAGNIVENTFYTDIHDLGVKFYLTAVGSKSQAQTIFDDNANKLQFTTSAFTIAAATCSGTITVGTFQGNTAGNPTSTETITLTSSSSGGTFYSNSTCTTAITTVTIDTSHNTASFFYKDTIAGTPTITATPSPSLTIPTQQETITAGAVTAATSTVSASPTSVPADGTTTSTITVTLKDANSNPVSGKTVTLAKGGGSSTITPVSGTTNASGQASFTVKDTVVESTTYTATDTTDSNLVITQTATVNFTIGPGSAANSTVNASPGSVTADGTATSTITVILKDASNRLVSGKTVTLAQGTGSSTISAASGPSDVNGVVTFTVKDTKAEAVTYTATDTTDTVIITQTATVTFTPGAAAKLSLSGSTADVTAGNTRLLTATIQDTNGNTVTTGADSVLSVTFAKTAGTGTVTGLSSSTAAGGVATLTVTGNLAGSITITASATGSGGALAAGTGNPITFTVVAGTATKLVVTGSATQVAGTGNTLTITAEDAAGNTDTNFGPNVSLTFSGANPSPDPATSPTATNKNGTPVAFGSGTPMVFTNGVVTPPVVMTLYKVETAHIVVSDGPSITAGTLDVTVTQAPANKLALSGSTADLASGSGRLLTATTQDVYGNTIATGGDSSLSVAFGKTAGAGTVDGLGSSTAASGVATLTVTGKLAGSITIRATAGALVNGTGNPITFNVVAGAASAAHSTITGTGPVLANGSDTSTITITLQDANTNPISGVTPTFSVTGSNNTKGACSVSNASGVSTCTLSSTTAETKTLSIVTPVAVTGGTVVFNPTTVATTLVLNSVSPNSVPYGSTGPVTFTAKLTRNDTNAGVDGATVNFSVDGGAAIPVTTAGGGVATYSSYNPSALSVNPHNVQASFPAATISGTSYVTSTSNTLGLTVIQATPTITWANPADITYGTALSATQLDATASVPGSFVYTPAAGTVLNAGNGQTLHVDFTPTDTTNYTNASKDVTINVLKGTPVITWANPADITYGTALSATQLDATADVPGSFVYTPVSGTKLNAGNNQTLHVNFTPTDTTNYKDASKDVTINVNQATPTVTVTDPAPTYDANPHSATATALGVDGVTPVAGSFAFTYDGSATPPTNAKTSYAVVASFTSTDPNYKDTSGNGTLTINKRPITVTAVTDTREYDGGVLSSGTPNITSGNLVGSDTQHFRQRFSDRNAGTGKTLIPTGSVLDNNGGANYLVTFVNDTTGVITPRAITVTAATDSKKYDGGITSTGVPTLTVGSLAPDDTATWTQTFDNKNVGNGNKTLTPTGTVSDGNSGNNYTVTFAPVHNGTITTRPITVTAVTDSKVYDGGVLSDKTPAITGDGLAVGDTAKFRQRFDTKDVGNGTKTLIPTGSVVDGNNGNNYAVTFVNYTGGTITPAPLSITANNKSNVYGYSPLPTLDATYFGFVASEGPGDLAGGLLCTTTAVVLSPAPGPYPITCSGQTSTNYDITYKPGQLTVTQASTTTGVTSSLNPSTFGMMVTFTATVSPQYTGVPTGIVTFKDGATTLGTGTLNGSGVATFATSALTVAAHTIYAVYAGDVNFVTSTGSMIQNVQPYNFIGFLPPIDNLPIVNSSKGGQTIPVKWQLKDVNGNLISDLGTLAANGLVSGQIACDSSSLVLPVEETLSSPGSTVFRFDGMEFIFNWQTAKGWSGSCRLLQVTLSDGTQHFAKFTLK